MMREIISEHHDSSSLTNNINKFKMQTLVIHLLVSSSGFNRFLLSLCLGLSDVSSSGHLDSLIGMWDLRPDPLSVRK